MGVSLGIAFRVTLKLSTCDAAASPHRSGMNGARTEPSIALRLLKYRELYERACSDFTAKQYRFCARPSEDFRHISTLGTLSPNPWDLSLLELSGHFLSER